jgi:hypothetical protein
VPTYQFRDRETGDVHEEWMSVSEMERYLRLDPRLEVVVQPVAAIDSMRMGRQKAPEGFRELLKSIKRGNRGSTIEAD